MPGAGGGVLGVHEERLDDVPGGVELLAEDLGPAFVAGVEAQRAAGVVVRGRLAGAAVAANEDLLVAVDEQLKLVGLGERLADHRGAQDGGDAARSLLAFGIPLKDVLGDVERLGDMSAATGRSIAETMPLGARALGQIASKGKLSMEEMNQLAEGIGLGQTAIRKELGMTQEEFADTFRPGKAISASKALPAIRRAMEKQSKGAAKLMSETTAGQFDAARERFARRMGQLTRPAFDEAGDIVGSLSKELDHIAGRKDISLDEKLTLSQQAIRRKLEPVADELGDLWRRNHMGERLADGFETAVPFLADKAAAAAPRVAGAFVNAWWQAGPWGKLFAAALLAKKLGAFGLVGELAAGRFRQGFGRGTASRKASYQALGSRMGAWMGPAVGAAMTVGIALALQREFGDAVGDILGAPTEGKAAVDADPSVRKGRQMMRDQSIQRQMRRFNRDHPGLVDRMGPTHSRGELDTLLRLGYPGLIPGSPGVPKDYVPGRPYGARTRAPRARGSSQVIHTHVMLNGREIARATNRVNDNERAHNRRPPK